MMRLVTEQVDPPFWMMMCDHPNCGVFVTEGCVLSALATTPIQMQEANFLTKVKKAGWGISLRQQVCPHHMELARQQSKSIVSSITPAPTAPDGPAAGALFTGE
jgi:hypothetical protein